MKPKLYLKKMGISATTRRKRMTAAAALFPRWFHRITCAQLPPEEDLAGGDVIRLIKCDGGVRIYDRAVRVREVMEEFPKHMVCRSDCFFIGQKTPALSGDHRLQRGQCYFLLPAVFFQSAVSFVTFIRCLPPHPRRAQFEVERTPSGNLRIKFAQGIESIVEDKSESNINLCSTPELRREYEQLVSRRRRWKPKLDTIAEKKGKKMRRIE